MGSPIKPKYPLFLKEINKGNTTVGGYPIVTVEDNFNIEAKPNTFYNIKNNVDSEVSINFNVNELYATGKSKYIMFTFDGGNSPDNFIGNLTSIGGVIAPDNTKEGYKYSMIVDINKFQPGTGITKVYFSDNIIEGNDVHAYINMCGTEIEDDLNNIHIVNNNIDYLYYITVPGGGSTVTIPIIILEEVDNDNSNFKYKYVTFSYLSTTSTVYIYTNEPCDIATFAYISSDIDSLETPLVKEFNGDIKASKVNEFIFNFNSPANIIFNNTVKWNNDEEPDLTKTGIYTISILNGVGCYTFVNY